MDSTTLSKRSKQDLQEMAKALGVSEKGTKKELQDRIHFLMTNSGEGSELGTPELSSPLKSGPLGRMLESPGGPISMPAIGDWTVTSNRREKPVSHGPSEAVPSTNGSFESSMGTRKRGLGRTSTSMAMSPPSAATGVDVSTSPIEGNAHESIPASSVSRKPQRQSQEPSYADALAPLVECSQCVCHGWKGPCACWKKVQKKVSTQCTLWTSIILMEVYMLLSKLVPCHQVFIPLPGRSLPFSVHIPEWNALLPALRNPHVQKILCTYGMGWLVIPLLISAVVNFESEVHLLSAFTFGLVRYVLMYSVLHDLVVCKEFPLVLEYIPGEWFRMVNGILMVVGIWDVLNRIRETTLSSG